MLKRRSLLELVGRPVLLRVKLIDLDGIARDRDQLWAEAAAVEAKGEPLTIPPELWGAASVEQQARVTQDAWEDLLSRHLARLRDDKVKDGAYWVGINDNGDREWRVVSSYLLGMDVLNILVERQTVAVSKRLAEVMRTLGWSKPPQTIRVGNVPCRGFTKAIDATPQVAFVAEEKSPTLVAEEPKAIVVATPRLIRRLIR